MGSDRVFPNPLPALTSVLVFVSLSPPPPSSSSPPKSSLGATKRVLRPPTGFPLSLEPDRTLLGVLLLLLRVTAAVEVESAAAAAAAAVVVVVLAIVVVFSLEVMEMATLSPPRLSAVGLAPPPPLPFQASHNPLENGHLLGKGLLIRYLCCLEHLPTPRLGSETLPAQNTPWKGAKEKAPSSAHPCGNPLPQGLHYFAAHGGAHL